MPRENRFARRAREGEQQRHREGQGKVVVVRDAQPSVDDQLARLEDDIRKLKVEFDIFFNGAAKRPPYDTKNRVETAVKRLADERNLTFAQRYRYNSLVARYVSLRDLWRRNVQDREEGRGARAAALAKFAAADEERRAARSHQATFICSDARADLPTVQNLYAALVEAKRSCGESADDIPFAQFHRMIAARTEALKERLGCESVRYSVYLEDGRVSFKAKAER
ncbi:MAG TPA: MXAN_5187 C-terminal domain-containing protein [Pyrinomonadaceae bacterium]|nr:MXAN_5187 C-terminal domain-containing protein [Pyrinomonadaceae bacterium]